MKWIKQKADVPTYRCSRCGSIWMTVKIKAKPPKRCKACGEVAEKTPSKACGAGGDNPSDLATLGHLPLHKGGTPPMAAKERLKMPVSAKEPDIFTDITGRESIIEGVRRAQVEAERRCIQANAVLINDEMFLSKLPFPPYGEVKMICGLKAFYCSDLPTDVLFAVCEIPQSKNRDTDTAVDADKAMAFIESYAFNDSKEIYTNGTELVPLFRVKQALVYKAYNGLFDGG